METYTVNITNSTLSVSLSTNDKAFILREIDELLNLMYPESQKSEQKLTLKKTKEVKTDIQPQSEQEQIKEDTPAESPASGNFADILSKKLQKNVQNVVEKQNSELENAYQQMQSIIKDKNLTTDLDYIITAAHCLHHFESLNRFTQKQINSKVYPFLMKDIDSDIFDNAINEDYIRILPDFTGVSDIIEYEITQKAEEYFSNEL
ncbi:MAG: hypothetical protein PHX18_02365 [Candidatus Gastranaerophilales bacterium]|nr:hypothetical protein [Candidatus Gastranaerophilales bacterium]